MLDCDKIPVTFYIFYIYEYYINPLFGIDILIDKLPSPTVSNLTLSPVTGLRNETETNEEQVRPWHFFSQMVKSETKGVDVLPSHLELVLTS